MRLQAGRPFPGAFSKQQHLHSMPALQQEQATRTIPYLPGHHSKQQGLHTTPVPQLQRAMYSILEGWNQHSWIGQGRAKRRQQGGCPRRLLRRASL